MGILTEEELNNIHDDIYGSLDYAERAMLAKLIESHVSLLSANAELKDENFDLKASVILNVRENKRLRAELEELK